MELLRNWALTVALAALAGGIVWLLAPKGSVQKAVRTVVAVFMLCAFLSPLMGRKEAALDWILPESVLPPLEEMDEAAAQQMQTALEAELTRRLAQVLETRGMAGQISLETDILPDGSIDIAAAKVILSSGADAETSAIEGLREDLSAAAGLEVELIAGG